MILEQLMEKNVLRIVGDIQAWNADSHELLHYANVPTFRTITQEPLVWFSWNIAPKALILWAVITWPGIFKYEYEKSSSSCQNYEFYHQIALKKKFRRTVVIVILCNLSEISVIISDCKKFLKSRRYPSTLKMSIKYRKTLVMGRDTLRFMLIPVDPLVKGRESVKYA